MTGTHEVKRLHKVPHSCPVIRIESVHTFRTSVEDLVVQLQVMSDGSGGGIEIDVLNPDVPIFGHSHCNGLIMGELVPDGSTYHDSLVLVEIGSRWCKLKESELECAKFANALSR